MNYHSDEWIMNGVQKHYEEALKIFPSDQIVGIFAQGSMNYGLDVENSDIDTKCIVVPTFDDLAYVRKPVSTTHIRANEEHIDLKDVRLYINCFKKQNLNFIEILFTPYYIVNPKYETLWKRLVANNTSIATYSPYRATKTMKGIALEKYHAMEHRYPSKVAIIEKWNYDPKQLHHLVRVKNFLSDYINCKPYEECLRPNEKVCEYLKELKEKPMELREARLLADKTLAEVDALAKTAEEIFPKDYIDDATELLLQEVQRDIMYEALRGEFI